MILKTIASITLLSLAAAAMAQTPNLKKILSENLQGNPTIDEISKTDIPGFYEVRVNGSEIIYTDEQGKFLFVGKMIDMKSKRSLTDERIDHLTAIKFQDLPWGDAITYSRGNGARKIAIFSDPNCSYCRRFENDLLKVDNVTVHVFLLPILGPDSLVKAKSLWCSPEKPKVWLDWMTKNQPIPSAPSCDSEALTRNQEFARKHGIRGTPAIYFESNRKVPGAIDQRTIETYLAEAKAAK